MLIFKVDFKKAFDSVSWKYLDFVLFSLGFGSKWRSWIRACLHLSRASILINGIPPLNFPSNLDNIIRVLHVFYLASSLKINIHKSNIFGIGVPNGDIVDMARRTGCTSGTFPFTYLGLPIGSNMNLVSSWQFLIDRFHTKVSTWKANLLSIGGRLTLVKAILGSLAIYYLLIYKTPKNVLKLFRLDPEKDCLIIDHIANGQWNYNWAREDISVRNKAYLKDLLLEISLVDPNVEEDSCVWEMANDGTFLVWDTRRLINSKILPSLGIDIPSISCSLCNGNVESSSYIFFDCDFAKEDPKEKSRRLSIVIAAFLGGFRGSITVWCFVLIRNWKKMETYRVDTGYMRFMKPLHLARNGNLLMLGTKFRKPTFNLYNCPKGNLYNVDLKKKHIQGKGKDKDKETRCSDMEIYDFVRYIETLHKQTSYEISVLGKGFPR
nr:reverse transcriptase domain, reverse transcriptase zinc-binding domain protein [Tanacetum cinerariifolium]